ncbi:MAG: hypothetical protein HC906_01665 [Bacteroidales bacterium]|nr:hypothetical protein [Bacteroidales bacterium]
MENSGKFLWVKQFGSSEFDEGKTLRVNSKNDLIIGGDFSSLIYFDEIPLSSNGITDAFIACLDQEGNTKWAFANGSVKYDACLTLTTDLNNNIYYSGKFQNSISINEKTLYSNGFTDIFLIKYSPEGIIQWSTSYGNSGQDEPFSIISNKMMKFF